MKHSDVLIVGGGPVGTILKLLLNKYGVSNILIEKRNSLSNRPRAHYISNRSMEVLRHLGHVDRLCQKIISPLERWRYISYVNDVASFPRVTRDCFSEYYTYGTTYYDPYSPCKVGNLGQNVLSLVLNGLLSDDISRLEVDCGFRLPLSVRSAIDNCRLVIPSDINFGTRLLSYELSDDRVVATVDNGNEIYKINW